MNLQRQQFCAVIAVLCTLNGCHGDPIAPSDQSADVPVRPPDFLYENVLAYCRHFGQGYTLKRVNGSQWEGSCPTSVSAVPSHFMGTANPGPVTFTFSALVDDVWGRALHNNCPGGCTQTVSYIAYGDSGVVLASGVMTDEHFDLRGVKGVRQLYFTPPAPMPPPYSSLDPTVSVVFDFDFTCPCASGDPVLDSPNVRPIVAQAFVEAKVNEPSAWKTRREVGGVIYSLDGEYHAQIVGDPSATSCTWSLNLQGIQLPEGAIVVARWHIHAFQRNELVQDDCPQVRAQAGIGGVMYADPDHLGGGSLADWRRASLEEYPTYVFAKGGTAARLDPEFARPWHAERDYSANPNRWTFNPEFPGGCYAPIS